MRYSTYSSIYMFSIILFMMSCDKQEFVADPGTPVFMAEIPFVNEETFEVVAGDELYYMFASHHEQTSSWMIVTFFYFSVFRSFLINSCAPFCH